MEPKCAVCMRTAAKTCSACLSVSYCGVQHQKQHWKFHKENCSHFRVQDAGELGKGLVVCKDISSGRIILEEAPAVYAAFQDLSTCITCGIIFKQNRILRSCSKCKWPVCSLECEKALTHAENECGIFVSKSLPCSAVGNDSQKLCDLLRLIRTSVLQDKFPKRFQKLLELDCICKLPGSFGEVDRLNSVKPILLGLGINGKDEEWLQLLRIFDVNSLAGTLYFPDSRSTVACVYLNASRINHSCAPNCSWGIGPKPDYKIRVRAATDIKQGEPVTISYFSQETYLGTKQRQERILKSGFSCKCARCLDPTELGTYFSAIICSSCQQNGNAPTGYLLPDNPLDLSESAIWRCNACTDTKMANEVLAPVEALGKRISESLQTDFIRGWGTPGSGNLVKTSQIILAEHSGRTLHPNNWILQHAMRYVLEHCSKSGELKRMDLPMIEYFISCGLNLLAIQDVLSPGASCHRARLQVLLAHSYQVGMDKCEAQKKFSQGLRYGRQAILMERKALKYYEGELHQTGGINIPPYTLTMSTEPLENDSHYRIALTLRSAFESALGH